MIQKLPPLDARIPKWKFDNLIERNCPICNSPEAHIAYERPDALSVRICKQYYTFFVSPSPSYDQLQAFYEGYDEKHRRGPRLDMKELAVSHNGVDPFADLRIRELSSLMKFEGARVLDIGFGRASFLYCLKKLGANPFGLELDTQAIEIAKFLGIEAFRGDLVDFVSETNFDLITLLDLVEHPLNPMITLRKASELLKPGAFWRFGLLMGILQALRRSQRHLGLILNTCSISRRILAFSLHPS